MKDLKSMNVAQLDVFAAENDIDLADAATKAEKIDIIQAALEDADTKDSVAGDSGATVVATIRGRTFNLSAEILTSTEFINACDQFDMTHSPIHAVRVLRVLFGDDYTEIQAWLRGTRPLLPIADTLDFLKELFEAVEVKN